MRVVFDTNILLRANSVSNGPARELLGLILRSQGWTLVLSHPILKELERVLAYSRVRDYFNFTDGDKAEYMLRLRSDPVVEIVDPGSCPRVVPGDPDDDVVVHTAVVGRAGALCTLNRHLFHPEVLAYCNERGIMVATDVDLLRILRQEKGTAV